MKFSNETTYTLTMSSRERDGIRDALTEVLGLAQQVQLPGTAVHGMNWRSDPAYLEALLHALNVGVLNVL